MRITGDEKHDENQIAEELENSGNKSPSVYLVRDDNGIVRTRSERENGIKRRICGKKLDLLSQPKILYTRPSTINRGRKFPLPSFDR